MWIFDASNPVGAEMVDVERPNSIIVHLMTATVANIKMFFVFAVFFVDTPALRATLAGVCGGHLQNKGLVFKSLVDQLLLKIIESP